MAAFSRGHQWLFPRQKTFSASLQFSTTPFVWSGHSKWSKIKHGKAIADQKKTTQLGGPDPNLNSRLANVLAAAKKAGIPKAGIDGAIARVLGKSTTGAALENITLEAMLPPSVAMIIECETDNKKRTLQSIRYIIKESGGSATPTSYMFQKKGRVSFEKDDRNLGVDEVLDEAIEAGAEDVEVDEDNHLVIWTEPSNTMSAAEALQKRAGLKINSCDITWEANEDTKMPLTSQTELENLFKLVDQLRDISDVQGVYVNVAQGSIEDEAWWDLESKLG